MVTTFNLLPLSQYQVRGAGHAVSQAGEVAVPEFSGPICVATTEAGRFVMASAEVGYDGQFGSFRIGYGVRDGVQREMLFSILALMPYEALPKSIVGDFRAWAIARGVLSAYVAFPTCEWHEVSDRIVHALGHIADWYADGKCSFDACEGMAGEAQFLDLSDGSFFSMMISQIADASSAGVKVCGEVLSCAKDVVVSALEVLDADVAALKNNPLYYGARDVGYDLAVDRDLAMESGEVEKPQVLAGVGCVDHQYDGDPGYVDALYKVAEEAANAFVSNPNRFKNVVDPFRHGFCYLLFYEAQDRAAVKAYVAEPVLTEGMYGVLVQEKRWPLSEEVVSFHMYGTRMHLSYVPGLRQAKADDVFRGLRGMYEAGRRVDALADVLCTGEDAVSGLLSRSTALLGLGSSGESISSGRSSPEDAFAYLSFPKEWKARKVSRFMLDENGLSFLRAMFVAIRGFSTASVGTTNLCDKGIYAIEDYVIGGGKSNSQSHAQLSRAVRGVLNASLNEGGMWYAFFSSGKKFEKLFESGVQ